MQQQAVAAGQEAAFGPYPESLEEDGPSRRGSAYLRVLWEVAWPQKPFAAWWLVTSSPALPSSVAVVVREEVWDARVVHCATAKPVKKLSCPFERLGPSVSPRAVPVAGVPWEEP